MSEDEILDLVDDKDEVIGKISRSQYDRLVTEKLGYIRVIYMFIRNSKGQLWVPKRTADKEIAPSGLDYSCGGHVDSGDDYDTSIKKEIKEELNITPDPNKLFFITKLPPTDIPYFQAVYIYESDETPRYNPDDFVSGEWMSPKELLAKLAEGTPAKSSIKEVVLELIKLHKI